MSRQGRILVQKNKNYALNFNSFCAFRTVIMNEVGCTLQVFVHVYFSSTSGAEEGLLVLVLVSA